MTLHKLHESIYNNYSFGIYRAVKWRSKYPPLAIDTEKSHCARNLREFGVARRWISLDIRSLSGQSEGAKIIIHSFSKIILNFINLFFSYVLTIERMFWYSVFFVAVHFRWASLPSVCWHSGTNLYTVNPLLNPRLKYPPLFRGRKLISALPPISFNHPSLPPYYSSLINDRLY